MFPGTLQVWAIFLLLQKGLVWIAGNRVVQMLNLHFGKNFRVKLKSKKNFRAMNYRSCFSTIIFLFSVINALSQEGIEAIKQNFDTYQSRNYREKVFLHTDKTIYATGEIIWFKAYITDAVTNNFSSLSKICYIEVTSAGNKPLLQAKVDINSGTGSGSFVIPSSIRSGNYLIRGYTNWMKNFDPSFYFEQPVTIINPDKKPELIKKDSRLSYGDTVNYPNVHFFPEGGNLVYGLQSRVAFKITNAYAGGMPGSGFILNEKNDTVVSFATEHFGMGAFSFTPSKGHQYHAIIRINNKTFRRDMPEIYTNGWTLNVKEEGNKLTVTVAANVEAQHYFFFLVQTKGKIKLAKVQYLKNDAAIIIVNKSDLDEGISQLTVFNEKRQPVCERLYFKKPVQSLQMKLINFQQNHKKREKVNLNLTAVDANGKLLNADMSVAVYLSDSLQPSQEMNISNYLVLSSDLKGPVESPQYYFENSGADVDKATDILMMTQGWRRFKWEDVLDNTKPSFTFLPEHEGHIITGRISPGNTGIGDTAIPVYLSVPGNNFKFSNSTSFASGDIKFNVEKFYGRQEIIVQPGIADSNYRIVIDNSFSEKYNENNIRPINIQFNLADEILLRSINAQSDNIYQPAKRENFILPRSYDTTAFFGLPSRTYYLDNYTRFPSMEEVMREYIKEVRVRNRKKAFHFEVFNEAELNYFEEDPLVLIDGVPVFDINKIIEVDPLKIKKIDIITNTIFQGRRQYEGIVSYSTYNSDLEGYAVDPASLVLEYDGLQFEREFYTPQYESAQQVSSRLPDYRNVLYWSPSLKVINGKQDSSFYTSDVPGKYIVLIQGISSSGLAVFVTTNFTVID
jgi:hypothetical protein